MQKNRKNKGMRKIAIIGAGVSGISVLNAMLKNPYYQDCEVVIYDQQKTFGTGLPYQKDDEQLLINQTADTMSLIPEDPFDFVKWLEKEKGVKDGAKRNFPRPWYGEYLKGHLEKAVEISQPTIIYEYATELRVGIDKKYIVKTASTSEVYDIVHLCMGNLPYQDPYSLIDEPNFFYQPYPVQEKLSALPDKACIGIIGTGLTSIDVLKFLKSQDKDYTIQLFSRKGSFPLYREPQEDMNLIYLTIENLNRAKKESGGFVPLETIKEWFILECIDKQVDVKMIRLLYGKGTKEQLEAQLKHESKVGTLQTIIYKWDPYVADFLNALTIQDKEAFFSLYEATFNHFRTPMPKKSVQSLLTWWNNGEIDVISGLNHIEVTESGFTLNAENSKKKQLDFLINATGHDLIVKPSLYQTELINQLVNEQIIQASKFGGIRADWPNAEVVSPRYGILKGFYAHGQIIKGTQYVNSARAIMLRAQQVVDSVGKEQKKNDVEEFSFH